MHTHRALIVAGGNPKHITCPNGLKGMHVAVQAGTKYEEYLKAQKAKIGFTLQSYPGDTDAIAQILLGRADAVLTQDTVVRVPGAAASGQDRDRRTRSRTRTRSGSTTARATPLGAQIAAGDQAR